MPTAKKKAPPDEERSLSYGHVALTSCCTLCLGYAWGSCACLHGTRYGRQDNLWQAAVASLCWPLLLYEVHENSLPPRLEPARARNELSCVEIMFHLLSSR